MYSNQFQNDPSKYNSPQPNPAVPPPTQWNAPPGGYAQNVSPNPQMWNNPGAQPWNNPGAQPPPQQWNNPAVVMPSMIQSNEFHQVFLKGKPKPLGITIIILGILHIAMGIGQLFTPALALFYSGIPFWGAIFNIIAGSLSVAAVGRPSMCLIKGTLGLSIVISIFSLIGVILAIVDFCVVYYCYGDPYLCNSIIIGGYALRSVFLVSYLIQFGISVTMSVYGCRAQNYPVHAATAQVFMVQNQAAMVQPSSVAPY